MSTNAGEAPDVRSAWDAIAEQFDRHATPHSMAFADRLLERFDLTGTRFLDVAAGSGAFSIPAAQRGADVVAVDISPVMVDRLRARARAHGLSALDARVGAGEALDLEDDTFDMVVSMNGISLFPDILAGLREAVRVTRTGGRVMLIAFGPLPQVEFVALFLQALQTVAPGTLPSPGGPLPPFRLADPDAMRRTLAAAALSDARVETAVWEMPTAGVDDYLEAVMATNPLAGQLTAGLSEEQFHELRLVLDAMLRERSRGDDGAVLRAEMRVGQGVV